MSYTLCPEFPRSQGLYTDLPMVIRPCPLLRVSSSELAWRGSVAQRLDETPALRSGGKYTLQDAMSTFLSLLLRAREGTT